MSYTGMLHVSASEEEMLESEDDLIKLELCACGRHCDRSAGTSVGRPVAS